MNPHAAYLLLRQANAAADCDPFDGHVLACVFAAAVAETLPGGPLTDALGVSGQPLRSVIGKYFPGAVHLFGAFDLESAPSIEEDELCLRQLLDRFRTSPGSLTSLLSILISRRATRPNHLWQDLGLANRSELSVLMQTHFAPLAQRNSQDMKWKKFFYRMICRDEGYRICVVPSCSECCDFEGCFGDESGESLLARTRLHMESSAVTQIQSAAAM